MSNSIFFAFDVENNTELVREETGCDFEGIENGHMLNFGWKTEINGVEYKGILYDEKKVREFFESPFKACGIKESRENRLSNKTVYFYGYNLKYDATFFMDSSDKISRKGGIIYSVDINGRHEEKCRRKVRDLWNFFKDGLDALAKSFDSYKPNLSDIDERVTADVNTTYNIAKFLQSMCEEYGFREIPMTAASLTKKIYMKHYSDISAKAIDEWYPSMHDRDTEKRDEAHAAAYYGGHTENYIVGRRDGNLKFYDVNSLYPSVMVDNDFPMGTPVYENYCLNGGIRNINSLKHGIYYAEIVAPDMDKPFLPVKEKTIGKLMFPIGKWQGWYPKPSLEYARELGYQILVSEGYVYPKAHTVFNKFVTEIYPLKEQASKNKDAPRKAFYKLLLNSLYGKWAQKQDYFIYDYSKAENEYFVDEETGELVHMINPREDVVEGFNVGTFPIWSIYTTAYAQIFLHKGIMQLEKAGAQVLYCDTDSAKCIVPDDFVCPLDVDDANLKCWKDETENCKWIEIFACKFYRHEHDGHYIWTLKGVPRANDAAKTAISLNKETKTLTAIISKPQNGVKDFNANDRKIIWSNEIKENKYAQENQKRRVDFETGETEPMYNYYGDVS